tara:strand:+ start:1869 stop:2183 length:315 start_codon:yes stop_codon:yes gene_type:complete
MKITKQRLKQIIKEELSAMSPGEPTLGPGGMNQFLDLRAKAIKMSDHIAELHADIPSDAMDEVGEEDTVEFELWHAMEGLHKANNRLISALEKAADAKAPSQNI